MINLLYIFKLCLAGQIQMAHAHKAHGLMDDFVQAGLDWLS